MESSATIPYSRRYFDLPELLGSNSILVIFLHKTTAETRSRILARIEKGDGTPWRPDAKRVKLVALPWLRNFEPKIEMIHELTKDLDYGHEVGDPCMFVDAKGIQEDSIVISHYCTDAHGEEQEYARVEIDKAYRILCEAKPEKSWFRELLSVERKIQKPQKDVEKNNEVIEEEEVPYKWPSHLPSSLKLSKQQPLIISFFHLSDAELSSLYRDIGHDERYEDVLIANWPEDIEPASEIDIWHIMDRVKPDWSAVAPYGETLGFFINSTHLIGPHRKPDLLVAKRERAEDHGRAPNIDDLAVENNAQTWWCKAKGFYRAWHAVWHGTGGARHGNVRENDAIRQLWTDGTFGSPYADISNPSKPVTLSGWDIPVFLLQPLTPSQKHALRALLSWDNQPQIIYVSNGDGSLATLIRYFQSPSFIQYNKRPPGDFIAVDKETLSSYDSTTDSFPLGKVSFILATAAMVWHCNEHGTSLARDEVGYVTGRTTMSQEDDFQQWSGFVAGSMGLTLCIENYRPDDDVSDGEGVERWYWDCFDVADEELRGLVETMQ